MEDLELTSERKRAIRQALVERSQGDYVPFKLASGEEVSALPLAVPDAALSQFVKWAERADRR